MIDTYADPALVVGHVIDAVRDRLAQFLILEVVDANFLRLALGMPFATAVLEIPHQFLLFRVDRDHRLPTLLEPRRLRVDELELGITIGMLVAFARLAVGLQAVAGFVEQPCHRAIANPMALAGQLRRQPTRTLARPAQGDIGSPRVNGSNNASKAASNVGSDSVKRLRPAPPCRKRSVTGSSGWLLTVLQFPKSRSDGVARQSCGRGDRCHASVPVVPRLRRCPLSSRPLIQDSVQARETSGESVR